MATSLFKRICWHQEKVFTVYVATTAFSQNELKVVSGIVLQKEGTYKKKYDWGKGFKYFLLNYRWSPVFLGNTLYIVRSTKQLWADLLCEDVQVDFKTHSTSDGTDNWNSLISLH
jgi:hypothetical protein